MNDIVDVLSKILAHLAIDAEEFRHAKTLLCQVVQENLSKLSSALHAAQRREEIWMEDIDPTSKFYLGILFYERSLSVPQDCFKATSYLNAILNAGKSEANYYLGMMRKFGNGRSQCNIAAFEFFNAGTRANDPKAMSQLALFCFTGTGVEVNPFGGIALAEQAADAEDPIGLSVLSYHKLYGYHTNKNPFLAFKLSEKAVEKGNRRAKMNLAVCYMNGVGVEHDAPKAVRLWTEAVEAGGYACMLNLPECYVKGRGMDVDWKKSASIYKSGSDITVLFFVQ